MDRLDPRSTPQQYPTDPRYPADPLPPTTDGAVVDGAPSGESDPWRYRDDAEVTGADLVDYKVEATDGGIGKIDSATGWTIPPGRAL